MKVYLDNSATSPMDEEVMNAMMPHFRENYGNPSSIHSHGRQARSIIEKSRKRIADLLQTSPAEIFFTSGGTEGDNTAIFSSIDSLAVKHVITSAIEHHAVLHSLAYLEKMGRIKCHFLKVDQNGVLDLDELANLVLKYPGALVSLMHVNNEIGNLNDIYQIGVLAKEANCYFHSDTVHAMGKYPHDLSSLKADFIVGAAHKFYGPKGCGFMYINHETKIAPYIHGGAQERNMRGGTENVPGIVGMTKALEMAYDEMEANQKYISALKARMMTHLQEKISGVTFNGRCGDMEHSLYSVLNVGLPATDENDMLLFNLDIKGISASGGSACASGSNIGSHVLTELGIDPSRGAIRFSFSKYNTNEEIDYAAQTLADLMNND